MILNRDTIHKEMEIESVKEKKVVSSEPEYGSGCGNSKKESTKHSSGEKGALGAWLFGFVISIIPLFVTHLQVALNSKEDGLVALFGLFVGVLGCTETVFIGVSQATALMICDFHPAPKSLLALVVLGSLIYMSSYQGKWTSRFLWISNVIYLLVIVSIGIYTHKKMKDR